ncbi:MAG: glycosyltransferase family 2 protein [Rhodocyclales bacterium]|nr:glycosyltransferase family 2 protein [Rhodocyclales bacterium]
MISIVCPVCNEQEAIEPLMARLLPSLDACDTEYELIFVDDGSRDRTLSVLIEIRQRTPGIRVIQLSRNFGKEAALTAGIDRARGDAVIPIDADLQDPPELIPAMIAKWREGYQVVLAKRTSRGSDTWLKRSTARWFYRLHNRISEVPLPENVGDFRLMDKSVVVAVRRMPERHRFMKGLFAWVGFHTAVIEYERPPRIAGLSKFRGWYLWNFALEGITSFSTVPLRIWSYVGAGVAALSFLYALALITRTLILGIDVPGYASIMTVVLFLGGLQLLGLGIIGEYLGRLHDEAKQRPIYIVNQEIGD